MKVEINSLLTIKNYAVKNKVTPAYIYTLIKKDKMQKIEIDGVQFIDTSAYPTLPTR